MIWLVGVLSFMGGGMFGVVFMCLFQINRTWENHDIEK